MSEPMQGRIFYVPLDVATTPTEGHVYCGRWWSVHPEHGVAFYCREVGYPKTEEPSPQCNKDRAVVEHCNRSRHGHEARLIPAVYAEHAIRYQRSTRPVTPGSGLQSRRGAE